LGKIEGDEQLCRLTVYWENIDDIRWIIKSREPQKSMGKIIMAKR
jgi:hypothetical protein